ncbi:MAG: hypothetical protein ACPLVI_04380 [Thermoplasmata archaeon]
MEKSFEKKGTLMKEFLRNKIIEISYQSRGKTILKYSIYLV